MQRKSGKERRWDRHCLAQHPLLSIKDAAESSKARERQLTAGPHTGWRNVAEKKEIGALIAIAPELGCSFLSLSSESHAWPLTMLLAKSVMCQVPSEWAIE